MAVRESGIQQVMMGLENRNTEVLREVLLQI